MNPMRLVLMSLVIGLAAATVRADEPAAIDGVAPDSAAVSSPTAVSTPTALETSSAPAAEVPSSTDTFVYPVDSKRPHIVSGFGRRHLNKVAKALAITTLPETEFHSGVDFALAPGSDVLAARAGKVIFAGFSKDYVSRKNKKEKSRLIIMRHADGMSTRYVHLNSIKVRPGQDVAAGDALGTSADSDEWTQPVLHFEVHLPDGKAVNPQKYLPAAAPRP